MTEMQSDFEDWLKEFRGDSPTKMPVSLEYMAWQAWQKAWQASRAAIVVKLGSAQNTSFEEWQVYHEDEIKDELKRLGVSYE